MLKVRPPTWALAIPLLLLLAAGPGCGISSNADHIDKSAASISEDTKIMAAELKAYREYLKTVTEQIRLMSEAIVALQKLGDSTVNLIIQRVLAPAPTPVPPPAIGDLFPASSPTPLPSATPGAHL